MTEERKRKFWTPDQIRHEIFLDEVSKATILKMLHKDQIPSIRMGNRWFIPDSWVQTHLLDPVEGSVEPSIPEKESR